MGAGQLEVTLVSEINNGYDKHAGWRVYTLYIYTAGCVADTMGVSPGQDLHA